MYVGLECQCETADVAHKFTEEYTEMLQDRLTSLLLSVLDVPALPLRTQPRASAAVAATLSSKQLGLT